MVSEMEELQVAAPASDHQLLLRYVQSRDADAFRQLVERHSAKVYQACIRIVDDQHAAEDALQAVFLTLARKAPSLPSGTILSGWLYRAACYAAGELRRSARRRKAHEQEAANMRQQQPSSPEQAWERLRPMLDDGLASLPNQLRDVVVLRYLDGRSEADVAAELGCPVGTVSARASRGVQRLRQYFSARQLTLPAALLCQCLSGHCSASAPAHLVASVQAACLGPTGVSTTVLSLTEVLVKAFFWTKVKLAVAAALVMSLLLSAGGVSYMVAQTHAGAGVQPAQPEGDGAQRSQAQLPPAQKIIIKPQPTPRPLYYERLTRTRVKDKPAEAQQVSGFLPDNLADAGVYKLQISEDKGATRARIDLLGAMLLWEHRVTDDQKKPMTVNVFGKTRADTLPAAAQLELRAAEVNVAPIKKTNTIFELMFEANGTISMGESTVGFLLLSDYGIAPLCTTGDQGRSLNDSWTWKSAIAHGASNGSVDQRLTLSRVEGQTAVVRVAPQKIQVPQHSVRPETIQLGPFEASLITEGIEVDAEEEMRVDLTTGAVQNATRSFRCKLTQKIVSDNPLLASFVNRQFKMRLEFEVEDVLISQGEADALLKTGTARDGLESARKRWQVRTQNPDAFLKEFAQKMLRYLPTNDGEF